MIYRSGCWSVVLPPTWHAESYGKVSMLKADEAIGVLLISSTKFSRTVSDYDLKKEAWPDITIQGVNPDELEPVRLGVLSGFTAKCRKSEPSWQEWWLRYGSLMISIHGPATCEAASPEQDAVMSILNSLQVEESMP